VFARKKKQKLEVTEILLNTSSKVKFTHCLICYPNTRTKLLTSVPDYFLAIKVVVN